MMWDVLSQRCPTREVLSRIGDKWSVLVVTALAPHPRLRFSELKRQIEGISQKMLTQTLRELERDGFVTRNAEATVPVTVRYALTKSGRSLSNVVATLRKWSYDHIEEIQEARQIFDHQKGPTNRSI